MMFCRAYMPRGLVKRNEYGQKLTEIPDGIKPSGYYMYHPL
jgi:hypothetical protein